MIREAGASEVHLRISSPPTQWPCFYGIDTPTRSELVASSHTVDEIRRHVTATSLAYLSLDRMLEAVTRARVQPDDAAGPAHQPLVPDSFCHACWSGQYPIQLVPPKQRQMRLLDA
jgi:amidophosphoribosyltransferase